MTLPQIKKALAERMADAEKEGLRRENEWQLGMNKLQHALLDCNERCAALTRENARLRAALDRRHE